LGVVDLNPKRPYSPPTPIDPTHRIDAFECGKAPLDDWLRAHALENEGRASRTFVVLDQANRVAAYYTLATGSVTRTEIPKPIRQGLPNPVPVMVLGRLAVDRRHAGKRLGEALLKEAMMRTLRLSMEAGVRALIVHAIDDEAVTFYTRYQFQVFPPETRTLLLPIETIRGALDSL
jgi:predicted N-acetyltransferase YhbS